MMMDRKEERKDQTKAVGRGAGLVICLNIVVSKRTASPVGTGRQKTPQSVGENETAL
jgi:hypothetical protein